MADKDSQYVLYNGRVVRPGELKKITNEDYRRVAARFPKGKRLTYDRIRKIVTVTDLGSENSMVIQVGKAHKLMKNTRNKPRFSAKYSVKGTRRRSKGPGRSTMFKEAEITEQQRYIERVQTFAHQKKERDQRALQRGIAEVNAVLEERRKTKRREAENNSNNHSRESNSTGRSSNSGAAAGGAGAAAPAAGGAGAGAGAASMNVDVDAFLSNLFAGIEIKSDLEKMKDRQLKFLRAALEAGLDPKEEAAHTEAADKI